MRDPGGRGGIVAVEVADPKPIVNELARRNVIVDYRPGIIRISPAFYNTEEEVVAAVEMLAGLVAAGDRT